MNDYEFGNLLLQLRTKSGLTQKELADLLQISDKTVSKWETGVSKPTTDTLKQLATIFNVEVSTLLDSCPKKKKNIVHKIVITGGPCAGKTTAMSWIQNAFTERGYHVIFVPECATELIKAGISGTTCKTVIEFQKALMQLQLQREAIYEQAAQGINCDKVLLVCDRGIMDSKAYLSELEFSTVLNAIKKNEVEFMMLYSTLLLLPMALKNFTL